MQVRTEHVVDWDGTDKIKTMMKRRTTKQKGHARVLLLAIVGGMVFAIIGMHGLTQNHTTSASAHSVPATQSMAAGAMAAEASSGHNQHGENPSGHGIDCGMLTLCLAAIIGGALLLWVAFDGLLRRPVAVLKRSARVALVQMKSVFRPPPDLISLSILRC